MRSNAVDVLVIDSVAALVPRAEIEGEMGDSHVGLQARLMSQALRKLTGSISRSRCTVIFINQVRMKIGVMYGNPETTTGGNALKFYASVRLDIRRTGQIKDRDDIVGNTTRVKVVKNKVAPPFKQVEFDIMYGDRHLARSAKSSTSGSRPGWSTSRAPGSATTSIRIGQGRENAKQYLLENPEMAQKIEDAVRGRTAEVGEALMVGPDDATTMVGSLTSTPSAGSAVGAGPAPFMHGRMRSRAPNSRPRSVHSTSPSAITPHSARPSRNGNWVPSNDWPMASPISAPPIVPVTPWNDEAVPAIGAMLRHRQRSEIATW